MTTANGAEGPFPGAIWTKGNRVNRQGRIGAKIKRATEPAGKGRPLSTERIEGEASAGDGTHLQIELRLPPTVNTDCRVVIYQQYGTAP